MCTRIATITVYVMEIVGEAVKIMLKDEDKPKIVEVCGHYNIINGKCVDCGEQDIFDGTHEGCNICDRNTRFYEPHCRCVHWFGKGNQPCQK